MFRWSPFPFLRLAIDFIIGILLYEIGIEWNYYVLIGLAFGYILGYYFRYKWLTGGFGIAIMILIGIMDASMHDPTLFDNHISKIDYYPILAYQGVVAGNEVEKERYYRYDLDVTNVLIKDSIVAVSGRIHLYLYKEDDVRFSMGDIVYVDSYFTEIPQPKNPSEFNYSDYIKRAQVYGQSFVHHDAINVVGQKPVNWLISLSEHLRDRAREIINENIKTKRERQIAQALLIGIKDYLEPEVKTAYASVGAMHVLAVSGLHVGIIYLILIFILKPLRLIPYGSYLIFVLILLGIWFYAMMTGLSPSVMRAATMFSVVSLKEISIRRTSIYNSLGLAAMVLLLFNPNFLFAVGFQLSFIAVFGIVYFHPRIYSLLKFEGWLFDKVWSISCISIAAQIATFPLSMYYFNQFPVYFLISNLIVIPGAMVLLSVGLLMVTVGFAIPLLASTIGWILTILIWTLNEGIFWIDRLPNSLITGLYLTPLEVWLCYGFIVFVFLALQFRSFATLTFSTVVFFVLMGSVFMRNIRSLKQRRMVFYEIPDKTAIDIIDGKTSTLLISTYQPSEIELLQFQIDPYRRFRMLKSISEDIRLWSDMSSPVEQEGPFRILVWHGIKVLILERSLVDYDLMKPINCDVFVLCNNAITDLKDLPEAITYSKLLLSSDYQSTHVRKLIRQASDKDIPIHSLSKDGYWMLDLNKTMQL
jgi:competence protein ComEC